MIAALAMACMAGVCAAGQSAVKGATPVGTYRISGVVVDAMTGGAVPGAELRTTGDVELRAVADGEGRFAFEGVEEGKYSVSATAPGYVREGFNQHGSFFTGIAVGSGLDSEHVVFKLHRQAVIYGRVTDERGDAVRRASVMLFVENVQYGKHAVTMQTEMLANDLGAYRFAHLMPGKYYVGVRAQPWWAETRLRYQPKAQAESGNGIAGQLPQSQEQNGVQFDVVYPVTYFAGATEDTGAVPLIAKAGDALEANVEMIAVPSIHMLLTNMDEFKRRGQGVSVFAVQRPFGGAANVPVNLNSTEVANGVFEVGGLPPGEVRLAVNHGGDAEWDTHGLRVNAVDGETVDATAKTAMSSVRGAVVRADGSKEEIQGEVVLRSGNDESSARLEKDGTFRIPAVDEGTYDVTATTPGNGEYVTKLTGTGARVTGKTVKIEGASEVWLTVTLGRGLGHVTGVAKMDGNPAAGLMVLLVPEGPGLSGAELEQLIRVDQSDSDGTFSLGGVVPGKYVLLAIEDGWELEWKDEAVLRPFREQAVKTAVGAGEEKKVTVEGVRKVVSGK